MYVFFMFDKKYIKLVIFLEDLICVSKVIEIIERYLKKFMGNNVIVIKFEFEFLD